MHSVSLNVSQSSIFHTWCRHLAARWVVSDWLQRVSFAYNESNDCLLHWHSKKETLYIFYNFEMNKSTTAEKIKIKFSKFQFFFFAIFENFRRRFGKTIK